MGVSLLAVAKSIYYHTFDELVFQEHSDIEVTGLDYLAFSSLQVRVRLGSDYDLRSLPPLMDLMCKSLYIAGALISLVSATLVGTV